MQPEKSENILRVHYSIGLPLGLLAFEACLFLLVADTTPKFLMLMVPFFIFTCLLFFRPFLIVTERSAKYVAILPNVPPKHIELLELSEKLPSMTWFLRADDCRQLENRLETIANQNQGEQGESLKP